MRELFRKYGDIEMPLIVESMTWYGDYCFALTEMGGDTANGIAFRDGEFYKEASYPLSNEFRVYNGPSKDAIRDYFREQ